jgi:hypothetical protein
MVSRSPLATQGNRPWQPNVKPAVTTPTSPTSKYATGGGMQAVRNRVNPPANNTLTGAPTLTTPSQATRARAEPEAFTRSGGAVPRNSPPVFEPDAAPAEGIAPPPPPNPPGTNNPRAAVGAGTTAQRELFPATRSIANFSSTQPVVSRSSTWAPKNGQFGQRFPGATFTGGLATLPTTNMSLDSATFGSLLHTRETKFLIPPFRAPSTFPSATPDMYSAAIPSSDDRPAASTSSPLSAAKPSSSAAQPNYFTIVFDLDETLCCNRGPGKAIIRPGALDLLKSLRALSTPEKPIEVILWTASVESLARTVLVRLDPDGSIFTDLIFRDKRWFKETGYTKDLRLLGRDMDRVVILENSPMSVALNRQNSILVKDFLGHSPHDTDLKAVKEVLESWILADSFVPIREWLAQHPRVDRNNHIIAVPALNAIVARTGGAGMNAVGLGGPAGVAAASPLARRALAARAVPIYGRRW